MDFHYRSTYLSIISFLKLYIISILGCQFKIIFHKKLIIIRFDFGRLHSLINCQVPGMLALCISVYEPDIHPVTVGIDTKPSGIDKFLLLSAVATAVIHLDHRHA